MAERIKRVSIESDKKVSTPSFLPDDEKRHTMQCRRCLRDTESRFRVYTDEINIIVCAPCADEARRIGLPVGALDSKNDSLLVTAEHRSTLSGSKDEKSHEDFWTERNRL